MSISRRAVNAAAQSKLAVLVNSCARSIRASMHIIACIEDPVVIEKIITHRNKKAALAGAGLLPEGLAPSQASLFA